MKAINILIQVLEILRFPILFFAAVVFIKVLLTAIVLPEALDF